MSKRSIAMTAALLVASLIGGIGPAQAEPVTKTIDVHSHYTEPAGSVDGVQCSGPATSPKCGLLFGGDATVTGTMWGDEEYDLTPGETLGLLEGKITFEGTMYINGGVEGCGTGTYLLEATEGYIDMTTYDPLTDTAEGGGMKWQLRPGSGTGELTNLVSGSGELHGKIHFAGGHAVSINPYFGEGHITGTITCRV